MQQPSNLLLLLVTQLAILSRHHSLVVHCSVIQPPAESLYHSYDNVIILTKNNFTEFVVDLHKDGQKLQLIQFYNSYCGHCIAFAPKFKRFLKSVAKWKDLLSISVVDCSIDENRDLCSDKSIVYYPTIRMFWYKPDASEKGEDLQLKGHEPQEVREVALKWISDNWKRGNIPANWPQFSPLNTNTKEELIEKLDAQHDSRNVVIIVEKDASFFGREMMMNLSRYSSEVRLYRMVESDIRLLDQILPKSLDTFNLPFLISYRDQTFNVLPKPVMNKQDDHEYFTKLIRQEFIKNAIPEVEEATEVTSAETVAVAGGKVKYASRVYMSDLNNAVRFALFHEVAMRKFLTIEQTNALIRFLIVLYDNFHFQNDKTRQFVDRLRTYLETKLNSLKQASNGSPVKLEVEDMLTSMNMFEDYFHLPEMKPWQACADVAGGPKRSYPCSLWSLFHVLTVAEYRRSLQLKQWSSLHASLYAMREYIRHFFGCTECAQHFVSMASSLENELAYPNSGVLWLWHAHNTVNARLKGSPSEIAQLPKRQFPTYDECSHCYRTVPDQANYNNATLYRAYYDETKLLQFLVEYYAVERLVPDKSEFDGDGRVAHKEAVLQSGDLGQSQPQTNEGGQAKHSRRPMISLVPFTSTDYSIIFIFYVVSITLLLSLCAFFKIRRSRNNRKSFSLLP